tara:strand:- start:7 stop:750 length:744 start_codon:yes stop_codon:yes gene_type:complete
MNDYQTPLVVLYSTCYRAWDNQTVINSQLKIINSICSVYKDKLNLSESKPILGIHYWKREPNPVYKPAPKMPPLKIMEFDFLHDITEQEKIDGHNYLYLIQSTKRALMLADKLHHKLYGSPMPDNQLVLRMRPDLAINYENIEILKEQNLNSLFYLSSISTNQRAANPYEIGDVMCLTTKKSLQKLFSIPYESYDVIHNQQEHKPLFNEQYLLSLIKHSRIKPVYDPNIFTKLLRFDNSFTHLSGNF